MRGRPTFTEALEEALSAAQDDTPRVADRYVFLPASAAPFVFVYSRPAHSATPARTSAGPTSAARASRAYESPTTAAPRTTPARAPIRTSRSLNPRQQRAVDAMTALGARLDGDFTAAELRRAFRRLAREYHPDRHPDSTPSETARLSRLFADLSDHYRCLLELFEQGR
jgi:hypothetical protein